MNVGTARAPWLIAILVLAGACVALGRQLGTERDRTQLETERITRLQVRLDSLQSSRIEPSVVAAKPAAATAGSGAPSAALPANAVVTTQTAPRVDPDAELARRQEALRKASAQMLENPESRKLALMESKTNLRAEYPNVGRQLHLSTEEEDQFLELLAEQRLQSWERSSKARASGQTPLFSQEDFEAAQRAEEAEVTALLGSQRARQFKEYQESLPERQRVMAFVATLDERNSLETQAAETLIARLADQRRVLLEQSKAEHAGQPYKMSMGFANGMFLTLDGDEPAVIDVQARSQMERYDKQMAEAAAPTLTAQQLKAFTAFQSRERESQLARVHEMLMDMQRRKNAAKPAQ